MMAQDSQTDVDAVLGSVVLVVSDVHLGETAGSGRIDSFNDALDVRPEPRPLLLAENHNRDPAACKILLVADVLVGRQR
ncbi:MAG: hypothetical protein ABSG56_16315 [Bryobacteraceae bacterium]